MTWFLAGARLALGAAFALAAASKIARPRTAAEALRASGVPRPALVGAAVASVESALAGVLVAGPGTWVEAGMVAGAALLAVFTARMVMVTRRAVAVPCGCFGGRGTTPRRHPARIAALLATAIAGAIVAAHHPAPQLPLRAEVAVVAVAACWAARVAAAGWASRVAAPEQTWMPPARLAQDQGLTRRRFLLYAASGAAIAGAGGTWLAREFLRPRASKVRVTPRPAPCPCGVVTDGRAVLSPPDVARPGYLSAIGPAPFGTTVTRIVGDPGSAIPFPAGSPGTWGTDARHHYSDDQPWNADMTLIAIQNYGGGSPSDLYLDGSTYRPRLAQCDNYEVVDDRWHPRLPTVRVNAGGTTLEWFDVAACRQLRSWTLPESVEDLGLTDGNLTPDGRFVVLGNQRNMFVLDMDPQPPLAPYPAARTGPAVDITYGGFPVDFVTISPSGAYAVVHYRGDHPRVFDIDARTLAMAPRPMPASSPRCAGTAADGFVYDLGHPDLALDPFDGNEDVLVGQEHCGLIGKEVGGRPMGGVVKVRLRDGKVTSLTDPSNEAYPYHVSTRNTRRPGWAYVTYYEDQGGKRFDQEIVAVSLDGSGTVERWAHHHSDTTNCYRCEPHAVPSPDGLRVLFASTWSLDCDGGCGTQRVRQAYLVDARGS